LKFLAADRRQREVGDRMFLFISFRLASVIIEVPIVVVDIRARSCLNDDNRIKEIRFKKVSKNRFFPADDTGVDII